VLCGQPCGKPLSCGVHLCQRSCHVGQCQTADQKCPQRCTIKRTECNHSCNAPCHGQAPCPLTTCRETIKSRCPCGRLEKDIVCNIKPRETAERNDDIDLAQSLAHALSVRTIDISLARKQKTQQPQLECDDECRVQQRNRKVAQAFGINPDEQRLSTVVYTEFLRDYAKTNLDFVQSLEKDFTELVEMTQQHRATKRCHSFKPMKKTERHVIHELASFYGLETQSMDPEPFRNVVVFAALGISKIPFVSLSETIRREKSRVPPPVMMI
jgi:transcriptional repressor NF-X1